MRATPSTLTRSNQALGSASPSLEAGRVTARELATAMVDARRMAHLAAIFSNPTRSRILVLLASHSKLTVTTLAILVESSVSLVSHNLGLMKTEGWIEVSNQGRMRQVRLANPERLMAIQYLLEAGRIARRAPCRDVSVGVRNLGGASR